MRFPYEGRHSRINRSMTCAMGAILTSYVM